MIITEHKQAEDEQVVAHNDDSDLHQDELGENTGEDTGLAKAAKSDAKNLATATSNKGGGPATENL